MHKAEETVPVSSSQPRDGRHQKERAASAGPSSKEEAQEEGRPAGRGHHGGSGSVLLPAGAAEGAAGSEWFVSQLRDATADVEARCWYGTTTKIFWDLLGQIGCNVLGLGDF